MFVQTWRAATRLEHRTSAFNRLAHLKMPISDKPEIGWPHTAASFFETGARKAAVVSSLMQAPPQNEAEQRSRYFGSYLRGTTAPHAASMLQQQRAEAVDLVVDAVLAQ
jgi:hypothetical protein